MNIVIAKIRKIVIPVFVGCFIGCARNGRRMSCHFYLAHALHFALRGVMGSVRRLKPHGILWVAVSPAVCSIPRAASTQNVMITPVVGEQCSPLTVGVVQIVYTVHRSRHPPFRLSEERLRQMLAGRPLRFPFSILHHFNSHQNACFAAFVCKRRKILCGEKKFIEK